MLQLCDLKQHDGRLYLIKSLSRIFTSVERSYKMASPNNRVLSKLITPRRNCLLQIGNSSQVPLCTVCDDARYKSVARWQQGAGLYMQRHIRRFVQYTTR